MRRRGRFATRTDEECPDLQVTAPALQMRHQRVPIRTPWGVRWSAATPSPFPGRSPSHRKGHLGNRFQTPSGNTQLSVPCCKVKSVSERTALNALRARIPHTLRASSVTPYVSVAHRRHRDVAGRARRQRGAVRARRQLAPSRQASVRAPPDATRDSISGGAEACLNEPPLVAAVGRHPR